MFDPERARRIEDGVDTLKSMLSEVKAKQELWLGNGRPGLIKEMREQLDDHEAFIIEMRKEKEVKETHARRISDRALLWGSLASGLSALGGVLGMLYHLATIAPRLKP